MDDIIPSGSNITDLPDDLMNNLTPNDDDLNDTIIPCKSTKGDLSQLEIENDCGDNQDMWYSGSYIGSSR